MTTPARTLTACELAELARSIADRPHLFADRVEHDPEERTYARVLASEHVEVWVVAWMDGHDTGFHDHDDAAAAIVVLDGAIREERLALGQAPISHRYEAGDVLTVAPAAIHRVRHAGHGPATTIHAYSPPLSRMGSYEIGEDGALLRHSRDGGERLEPAAA